eukprot:TRINITY_DN4644_c0_g1_i1.p1 TRINITY_DN4644_c0_g1~~TRINITY_DN4644_c0_g1_i1.p1  ORF type:complete len:186 (-),score=27.19 TRINITY_DN4644_c0_g1_i1:123-680(-)
MDPVLDLTLEEFLSHSRAQFEMNASLSAAFKGLQDENQSLKKQLQKSLKLQAVLRKERSVQDFTLAKSQKLIEYLNAELQLARGEKPSQSQSVSKLRAQTSASSSSPGHSLPSSSSLGPSAPPGIRSGVSAGARGGASVPADGTASLKRARPTSWPREVHARVDPDTKSRSSTYSPHPSPRGHSP